MAGGQPVAGVLRELMVLKENKAFESAPENQGHIPTSCP